MLSADSKAVRAGTHFLDGDSACAEGAIAAGCRFCAGYPITPSTEVVELLARRFPKIGGMFIQMEDEIASSITILGAAWGGAKTMTVTSGPGFSLMMEHIGYAIMTETPCVFVNVQRGGPSTGLPTLPGQQDMMQVRWGSHGDFETIALCPNSPQECFDMTIQAFNLAEKYRTPVFLMMDECIGHMMEKVVIPPADDIKLEPRHYTGRKPGEFYPYSEMEGMVPKITRAGLGHNIHVTGLTHDERGYPAMQADVHQDLVQRLMDKIRLSTHEIIEVEEIDLDDADIAVVSYGISSRVAMQAMHSAKSRGISIGMMRLKTAWPFPEQRVQELAKKCRAIVMVEMNMGQMLREVERHAHGACRVIPVLNAGGAVHRPEEIVNAIMEAESCLESR